MKWYMVATVAIAACFLLELQATRVAATVEAERTRREREGFIRRIAEENSVSYKEAEEWQKINEVLGVTHEKLQAKTERESE